MAASRATASLSLATAAAVAAVAAATLWARGTRASPYEKRRQLPGDERVPNPMWHATRAITIDEPPQAVWP